MFKFEKLDCLIIDNYENNIEENFFYSILNHFKQLDTYIVVNSFLPIKNMKLQLKDLKSRTESFVIFEQVFYFEYTVRHDQFFLL